MSEKPNTYQIYDKVFKKILTLSATAVVNLINGLFDTNHPPNSTITYNWTEHIDDHLHRYLADTILTVNGYHSYHLEAQMSQDEDIVLRVFNYSYGHALNQQNAIDSTDTHTLRFPETKVIYLFSKSPIPDEYILTLDFGSQGTFSYKVPTFKFLEHTIEELNQKKMIILIPFSLLLLRKEIKKERTPENILSLKRLLFNGIIKIIDENVILDNLTVNDAYKLKRLTQRLQEQIYAHYTELEALTEMTDEALILDIDILEYKYEKLFAEADAKFAKLDAEFTAKKKEIAEIEYELAEKNNEIAEKENEIAEKENEIAEKENEIAEKDNAIAEKDNAIAEKNNEIARLKAELELLRAQ